MTRHDLARRIQNMLKTMSMFEVQAQLQFNIDEIIAEDLGDIAPKLGEAHRELRKLTIASARADTDGLGMSEEKWVEGVQDANLKIYNLEEEKGAIEESVYRSLGLL